MVVEICRFLKQHVRKADNGRERVIDVVSNTARHLTQRSQPFLPHSLLLTLNEFDVDISQIIHESCSVNRLRYRCPDRVQKLYFGRTQ